MKKSSNKGKKQAVIQLEITRHHETLSPKEADEVVDTVADLIVNFIKKGGPKSGIASSGEGTRKRRE